MKDKRQRSLLKKKEKDELSLMCILTSHIHKTLNKK